MSFIPENLMCHLSKQTFTATILLCLPVPGTSYFPPSLKHVCFPPSAFFSKPRGFLDLLLTIPIVTGTLREYSDMLNKECYGDAYDRMIKIDILSGDKVPDKSLKSISVSLRVLTKGSKYCPNICPQNLVAYLNSPGPNSRSR
jgi:hypothetical protein